MAAPVERVMLGVGGGRERDGARRDGPDADVGEARDACREDRDESEHVLALMAATRTGKRLSSACRDSVRWRGKGCEFVVSRWVLFRGEDSLDSA